MSSPPNPLDSYRTYSYHHILVACDSTQAASDLVDAPLTDFDHPTEKFCPKTTKNNGNYVVLINGMVDSQFYISSVKWSSVLTPRVAGREQAHASTTMAVDGEMEIVEPQGVTFYNLLNAVTKSLRIDPSSMVYVLKTVFVGTTDYGVEEYISTIKPLPFMLADITSVFDYTGAQYSLSFIGLVNGVGKTQGLNSIVQGFTCELPSDATIPEALAKVETTIRELYKDEKDKAFQAAEDAAKKQGSTFDREAMQAEFMDVEYRIRVDEAVYGKYKAGDLFDGPRTKTATGDAYISDFGEVTTIERIIDEVMRSSKQVVHDIEGEATDSVATSKRKMYKITSDVTVDRALSKYVVTYYVNQYVGTVVAASDIETFEPKGPDGVTDIGITFDYIFTGQNVDVVDFNLTMQYGLTFLQMLGVSSSCPLARSSTVMYGNHDSIVAGVGNKDGAGDQKSPDSQCSNSTQTDNVVKKPLFLGTMVTHPAFRDTRTPASSAGFNALLHRIAALENIGAKMKIRGNPQLLEDTNLQQEDLLRVDVPDATLPNSERSLLPNLNRVPGYIKVNVKIPKGWTNDESEEDALGTVRGDYANSFWYKGWYMLMQIDHVFSDGEFTQDLEIYSLPTDAGQSAMGMSSDAGNEASNKDENSAREVPSGTGTGKVEKMDGVNVKAASEARNGTGKWRPSGRHGRNR